MPSLDTCNCGNFQYLNCFNYHFKTLLTNNEDIVQTRGKAVLSSIEWCIPPILTNHVVCGYWSHWHTGYLLWTSMCLQCNLDQLSAKRSFWHQLCTSTSWTVWIDLLTLNLVNRSFWHQLCSSASLTVWIDSFDTSFAQVPLEPCE